MSYCAPGGANPSLGSILSLFVFKFPKVATANLFAKRCKDKLRAEEHARLMARLQRAPVIRGWNYVTSRIFGTVSPQSRLSQMTYLLTCWRLRRVGDYGYMEPIAIMTETRERDYWEIFRKGRQAAQA